MREEGRFPEAEKLYSEVIAAQRRVLGPEHPQTLRAMMMMLAVTMMKEGNYDEADKLQSQIIEIKTRVLGPTHTSTQSMEMKALGLSRKGQYAESEKMFRDVVAKRQINEDCRRFYFDAEAGCM